MYRLAKLCAALVLAAGLHLAAQTGAISWQAIDQYGQPLPHAQVRVCSVTSTGTPCTPTVPIYLDYNLTTPVSNPYSSDQYGNFSFYVPALSFPNIYLVQLSPASGITWSYLFNGPGGTGGSGCITSGAVGVLVASNGSGGCEDAFVQVNGVNLATPSPINFVDSATVAVTNPATGQIQFNANPTLAIDTNGTPNTSQTVLSFTDSSTIQFTNPSGGVETATCVTGTDTLLGCMKPDNTTINVAAGTLTVPTATDTTLGIVRPDNTTVTISGGVLSATPSSSLVIKVEGSTTGVNQGTIDFNSTFPAPPSSDFVNCTWQNDTATGAKSCYVPTSAASLRMWVGDPLGTQHVIIYPTSHTISTLGAPVVNANNSSSTAINPVTSRQCGGSSFANVDFGYVNALSTQAPWVNPANVTAVYAFGYASTSAVSALTNCGAGNLPFQVGATSLVNGGTTLFSSGTQYPLTYFEAVTGLTGATIDTATATSSLGLSGASGGLTTFDVPAVGFIVYYTGTAPPVDTAIQVMAPLNYSTASGHPILSIDPDFPWKLHTFTVATLPDPTLNQGWLAAVSDGNTGCTVGSGTSYAICYSDGTNWQTLSSGGGSGISGGTAGQLAIFGSATTITSGISIGNTGSSIPQLSGGLLSASILPLATTGAFGAVKPDGTTITISAGVISAVGGGSGTTVTVNGGSGLGSLNINAASPSPDASFIALTPKISTSNLIIEAPYATSSAFGVVKPDNSTITISAGVISAVGGGGTTTNALTMNNSGAGDTSGTTFNGSAAKTISYNTIGAQQALTLTTTGTSGAATLSAGTLNIPNYAGSTGLPYPVVNGLVFAGDSLGIITQPNNTWTASAISTNGTTVTVTTTTTAPSVGTPVLFYSTQSPSCMTWTNARVLTSSGTTFTVSQATAQIPTYSGCTGSNSGSGGTIWDVTSSYPEIASHQMPFFTAGGTVTPAYTNMHIPGDTVVAMDSNYTARYHPYSPAVTGITHTYFVIQAPGEDICSGSSVATIKAAYQSLWAKAHTDGYTILQTTILNGYQYTNPISCGSGDANFQLMQGWLIAQQQNSLSPTDIAAGKYYDKLADGGGIINNPSDSAYQLYVQHTTDPNPGHFTRSGAWALANEENNVMMTAGSSIHWTQPSTHANIFDGYQYAPQFTFGNTSLISSGGTDYIQNSGGLLALSYTSSGNNPALAFTQTGLVGFSNTSGGGLFPLQPAVVGFSMDVTHGSGWVQLGTGVSGNVAGHNTGSINLQGILSSTATAPTGSCSINGEFRLTADGLVSYCSTTWKLYSLLLAGTATFTPGTNVTSTACTSGYTCTNSRGEFTIVGGTATTGTIATVNFSTTLAAAPFCTISENGNGSATTYFALGHGTPSTSSFTVTAGVSVASSTIIVDYQCSP